MSEDDAEREHEPTPQKLDEARRKGDVARSAELATAAAYAGFLAAAVTAGPALLRDSGARAMALLDLGAAPAPAPLAAGLAAAAGMLLPALPFLLAPAAAVLAAIFAQRALVVAPDRLHPKLSRIDPVANAVQKFGRAGLMDFLKSSLKLTVVSALLGWFILARLPELLRSQAQEVGTSVAALLGTTLDFLMLLTAVVGAIAAIDWLWQRFEFLRRNRMSRQELLDELKQAEGDPHVKGQRRRRAETIATQKMLSEVPKADVIIVNPTHYAVALRWDRGSGRAPVCIAKGVDEIAARIRERAAIAGVPIRSDPPAARALHASVEVGREIRAEHYAAVAAAIRFAEAMRAKARTG